MSGGKDDFLETIAAELEQAEADDIGGKKASEMLARAGVREQLAELQRLQAEPIEPPPAEPSERVEHLGGVALPASVTLEKIPKVQLAPRVDPRRADTVPSIGAASGAATGPAGLAPSLAAEAVVGERTVGGNTGRFKDGVDQGPASTPARSSAPASVSPEALGSHELPVVPAPRSRRWLPALALALLCATVIGGVALRGAMRSVQPGVVSTATASLTLPTVLAAPPSTAAPPTVAPAPGGAESATTSPPMPATTSKPKSTAKPGTARPSAAPYDPSPGLPLIIESEP